jgi:hypothetical protein
VLAERLASWGHRATLVSTPGNVTSPPPAPRVDLVVLLLPRVDELLDDARSTNNIPQYQHKLLIKACDGLVAPSSAASSCVAALPLCSPPFSSSFLPALDPRLSQTSNHTLQTFLNKLVFDPKDFHLLIWSFFNRAMQRMNWSSKISCRDFLILTFFNLFLNITSQK